LIFIFSNDLFHFYDPMNFIFNHINNTHLSKIIQEYLEYNPPIFREELLRITTLLFYDTISWWTYENYSVVAYDHTLFDKGHKSIKKYCYYRSRDGKWDYRCRYD
jgi:hypothetical protein